MKLSWRSQYEEGGGVTGTLGLTFLFLFFNFKDMGMRKFATIYEQTIQGSV